MAKKDESNPDVKELENEADVEQETITVIQNITIPTSTVTLDSKTMGNPELLKKEEVKQEELAKKRRANRIAKLKAKPLSPLQIRKNILEARFRKVKSRKPHNYRKEQLVVWAQEYELIKNRPESWSLGCVRAKKAKTAQDFIDELQIDD